MTTLKPENRDEIVDLIKRGRRSRQRGKRIEKVITELISSAGLAFLHGWTLMLAVGVIHAEWIRQLPTVGYWWAVVVVALLRGTLSRVPSAKDKSNA